MSLAKSLQPAVGQGDRLQHVEQALSLLHERLLLLLGRAPRQTISVHPHLIPADQAENHDGHDTCNDKPESSSGHGLSSLPIGTSPR